jgi:glycosyltransferase involved in cell wall biosynthesis
MTSPFFSIIIPVYNRSALVRPAIESVLGQTFTNWELVVVDDASTDDSVLVVEQYCKSDSRITLVKQPFNQERGAARNKGIEMSRGQYICFLDSDDAFCDNHLQVFFDHINRSEKPSMWFTNSFLSINGATVVKKIVPAFDRKNAHKYLLVYTPNPARVCVSSSILEELKFDPTIPGLEDIDLWLRIATKYPINHIEEYTNIYNVHEGSYTLGDAKRYEKELKNFAQIFAKKELKGWLPFWGKRRLLSMCCFHLSQQALNYGRRSEALRFALRSLVLFPRGYNGKTNKIVLATIFYSLPIIKQITADKFSLNSACK